MTKDIYDLTDTWNDAGVTWTAIKMDVTNTASHANSRILDLLADGSSVFSVDVDGKVLAGEIDIGSNPITAGRLDLDDNQKIRLGTSQDVEIYFDGTEFVFGSSAGETLFKASPNAEFAAFYNNELRFYTRNEGVMVYGGTLFIQEQAAAEGDTSGYGQIYVKNDTPNTLWFVDDAGNETQLVASGLEPLVVLEASSSAALDFTGFDSTKYESYVCVLSNVKMATDGDTLEGLTSTDGGSNWDSGASDYRYRRMYNGTNGTDVVDNINIAIAAGNAAGERINGWLEVFAPDEAEYTHVQVSTHYYSSSGILYTLTGVWVRESAADVTGFRLIGSSGNIESGTITWYGRRKAS